MKILKRFLFNTLLLLFILAGLSLNWAEKNYGNIGFEEIIFHLRMPLKGTSETFILDYIKNTLLPTIIVYIIFLYVVCCLNKKQYTIQIKTKSKERSINILPLHLSVKSCGCGLGIVFFALVVYADKTFDFFDYLKYQFQESTLIEEEYVDPIKVNLEFPENKRNLITIFIESAETTAQNKENGGLFDDNYISELTEIAEQYISFSQSELIEGAYVTTGTGWTIAALVAQTSGLPLKLVSSNNEDILNSMDKYESFMPGATTLGDLLEAEGYYNCFMAGSDFEFGGRMNYFKQHGNYEIWDYYTAIEKGKIDSDYKVWWGFEDEKLYSYAKEKLLELSELEEPFNFSMLTVDTHHQDGYVCENCEDVWDVQYANVWSCASKKVNEFLGWIKEQEFYENTTIVIVGDHYSMDTDFYEELYMDDYDGNAGRYVYNVFINSAVEPKKEKNRRFTTMDLFPTVLASIGVSIEGERLALGTNLFSETQTLAEQYGYTVLDENLSKVSKFYNNYILFSKSCI